jgi:hypothetical protein
LLKKQMQGGKAGYNITTAMVNTKYFDTLLPNVSGFRSELPAEFVAIKESNGRLTMNKVLVGKLFSKYQLFSDLPLIHVNNRNQIGLSVEMDADKPSLVGTGGALTIVPMHERTAEMGYPMDKRSMS